jgi:hypothetical protein
VNIPYAYEWVGVGVWVWVWVWVWGCGCGCGFEDEPAFIVTQTHLDEGVGVLLVLLAGDVDGAGDLSVLEALVKLPEGAQLLHPAEDLVLLHALFGERGVHGEVGAKGDDDALLDAVEGLLYFLHDHPSKKRELSHKAEHELHEAAHHRLREGGGGGGGVGGFK